MNIVISWVFVMLCKSVGLLVIQLKRIELENEITEVTRLAIIDHLTASNIYWSGRLNDDEFLARIMDLNSMPSNDPRYINAAGDIHQHRVRNFDWDDHWVFYDS